MEIIADLVVRMARENRGWGYSRIQGALQNVGHRVGRTTISNIFKENGIDPAPERGKRTTWSQFLKTHWNVLAATDFFTVDVWGPRGLVIFYVLFLIDVVRLPPRSPNLNAYAAHYHRERNHQGVDNRLIEPDDRPGSTIDAIECVQRLGGMLCFYRSAAA